MKEFLKATLIALVAVLVVSVAGYALERVNMGVDNLTTKKVKNTSGTTVIDVGAGTSSLTNTGHSSLDLPLTGGDMNGAIKQRSGRASVFPNISTPGTYNGYTPARSSVLTNVSSIGAATKVTADAALPKAGGSMTGPPKQRTGGAAVFPNVSSAGFDGNLAGNSSGTHTGPSYGNHSGVTLKTGTIQVSGHAFSVMTSTINGINRNILYY